MASFQIRQHDPSSELTNFGPTSRPLLLISHLSKTSQDKEALKELWLDCISEEQYLAASLVTRDPSTYAEILRSGRSARSKALLQAVNCADNGDWAGADDVLTQLASHHRNTGDVWMNDHSHHRQEQPQPQQPEQQTSSIEGVRGALGLHLLPPQLILEQLLLVSSDGTGASVLDFKTFALCLTKLVNPDVYGRLNADLRREHLKLLAHLFEAICLPRKNVATVRDCGIALSMFAGGTVAERTSTAFWCFDVHEDGFVRQEEMVHYLTVTFTTIFALTENETNYCIDDLAQMTAYQCFEEADVNHDGTISWEEFVRWFSSSGL